MKRTLRRPRLARSASEDVGLAKYNVVSDLPERLPITEWELELLEAELSDFIEELLTQGR
ncbi:MAG TPA: hypothetical protein VHD95_06050 [Rhizomicrobium sp.]|nr:hypothetical protein [Rhizomicrobium sp.]